MQLSKIYLKLPYQIKFLLLNWHAFKIKKRRYSIFFLKQLETYKSSNQNKIDLVRLREFMISANKTKFWNKRFKEFKVDIKAEDLVKELKKLPVTTKTEIKLNSKDIVFKPKGEKVIKVSTSGTTGSGMTFPITNKMESAQWAVWWRFRMNLGINFNDWMGWFGGKSILSKTSKRVFIKNIPLKQIMFNPYKLNENNIAKYYKEIKTRKLKWLHGYPSQISQLAQLLIKGNFPVLEDVQFITIGAESLLEHQKNIIEKCFRCKVYQHYGLAEGVSNISQNIDGKFIIDQDFAITELVPVDMNIYRIVGTNYNNSAFPLIRYDTGDFIEFNKETNQIISIEGRQEDYITLIDGTKLGRLDHIFKNYSEIKEAQIFQNIEGEIELRIVLLDISINKNKLIKNLLVDCHERFGSQSTVSVKFQNKITKTKLGKLKFVISEIK